MQKKYYSKFTASKKTKKSGSSASSVARNTKSSYDDKPDDIGEIPWLIAKGATEGWSNEKFQTEFKRAQSSINVPRTRQYTDAARDDLVSWLSPDKYSDLEAKASNTYIPAQFGQRMLDNERMREYAERYQNTYIPATLAQDAIHRSGTGNDFNALTDNALRSEFLRKLDTKSMQDELDALNNDLDSNKQQYNRTKAQYASYGNNTSDNGARAAKRYIDDYEAKQKRAAELERDIYDASGYQERSRFESMRQNQDFAEKSSVSSSKVAKLDLLSPSTWNDSDEKYDFINDINGYRKKLAGENPGHYSAYESAYGMMSNDEVSLYNYVYATEGKDAADRYLSLIEEDLNRREGMRQAELIDGKPVAEVLYMLPSGLDSWVSGAKQNFSRNPLPVTSFQFGSELVREDLSERGTVAQVAGDIAYSVGNMAPSIIVSSMLGGAGIGELAGAATLGLGARGNAYANALREGYSYTEASNYATLTGASEAALQYLIGGVGKLGGKVTGNVIAKSIRNIDNALIRVVLKLGGNMLSEGSEEYLQSILEPVYRNLCFNENNEFHLVTEDAAYSFLLGALTAGLLEGGSDIYGGINESRNGNAILSSGKYDALLDSAIALGEKSEAAKIAQELRDGKIHANSSNVGKLLSAYLNEGGDITSIIPSEQNTAEAQSAEEILRNGARAVAERETARMNANAAENVVQQNTAQIQPVTLDNANSVSNTNDTRKTAETSVATSDTATKRTVEHRSASEAASSLRSAIERSTDSVSGLDVYSDEDGSVTVSRNGSVLAEMDAREASAMASSYDSETNAIDYIGGFHAAYQLASEGMTINQITDTSILASDLTRAQLQAAYDSGRNASIESKRAAALDPKASGFKAGVNRIDQSTNLSRKQRSQIRILDAIGKKYGVEIIVDDGVHYSDNGTMMSRSDANGFYNPSTGRIHINLNAVGEAYLAVGMHELVHHVKNFNESGYNTLESVVLGALEERGENVDALVKYQMEHFGYSESQAREEVVANSIPAILNDEAYVRKLVETDRTLAERIRDFLSDFVEFINETLRALEGEASWKQMRSLREDMDMLSTIAELFDTALEGAGETVDSDGYVRPSDASSTSDIINDTADGIIEMPKLKWSAKTLNEKQLKDSLSQRQAQILGIPYSIEKVGRNGKTGVFATTMDVTEAVMKKNGYSASDVKTVRGFMKRVSDYLTKQAANEYRFVGLDDINSAKIYIDRSTGKVLLSCRVKNGEYDVNFDFTKVCKKREAMQRFIDDLARSEGRNGGATMLDEINLSPENIFKMNTILKDAGYETACLGCFVEAKRYNIRSWAETIVSEWNDLVLQRNPNAVYFGFATGDTNVDKMSDAEISKLDEQLRKYNTDGTSSATERMPRLMDASDGMLKLLRTSDLITTQGRTALHEFSSELESIVASRYGTASPKSVEAFTPYNSEIALLPDSKTVNGELMSMADYLLKIAGVRSQSFSDFIITHVLDHLQKTVDLAARGFTAHTYTKEIARAMLFGMSGEKINLSVMFDIDGNVRWEYAGLDADGNYIIGDSARASLIERITGKRPFTQSIDFNAAVELEHDPQYSKNCGIIGVGYSYNHILKMLRDNNIPYIIAYHRSGLPTVVATASNVGMATDYTSVQNTLQFKSGAQFSEVHAESDIPSYATWNASKKAKRSKLTFDLKAELAKTGDPQKAMKNFLSFMEENNLTPNVKKKAAGHGSFDLYGTLERTGSPKATADAYISWCIENGSIPMLYEFAAEDNYWKFLFDFSVIDLATGETAPQRPVSIDWLSEMGADRFVEMVDKYMKQYNEYRSNQFGSETESSKYADTKEKVYNALKFSLKDASTVDVAAVERENSKLMKSLALAEDQVKLTRGHRVKEGYIGVLADKALRDYSSSYDSATLKDNLIKIFKFLAKSQKPNMGEVNSLGVGLMKAVLEKSSEFDSDGYNAYSDVRSYLRSTSITLSEDQRAEAAVLSDTYGKYRSSLFGSVKLTNDGLQLDTAWQELSSMNSALFPPETNASDMPRVLAVAAEAIKRGNFYTNPYGYDLDAFAADAWSNILESYFKSQTFADVKQSEIDALNQKMRDERNAARKDAKAAEREIMRNAEQYAKDIAKRDKREAALRDQVLLERVKGRDRMKRYRENRNESEAVAKYRKRIERNAKDLTNWLIRPTDAKHVPEVLRKITYDFMQTIDFAGDSNSKVAIAWRERMRNLKDAMQRAERGTSEFNGFYADIDPDLVPRLEAFIDTNKSLSVVSDMNSEQLRELDYIVGILKHAITDANKLHSNARNSSLSAIASASVSEMEAKRAKRISGKFGTMLDKFFNADQLDSFSFFDQLGDSAKSILTELRSGFDKKVVNIRTAIEFMNSITEDNATRAQMKNWTGSNAKAQTFKLSNGKEIALTIGQVMELYCLNKREQARGHIYGGGIKPAQINSNGTKSAARTSQTAPAQVTQADVDFILSSLTEQQRYIADKMQSFMNGTCADWGNEVSLTLYGYKKFTEANYYPIKSDENYTNTKEPEKANGFYTLKNLGMTKATVANANNPLVIGDIFDTFSSHVDDMATYNALVVPLSDAMKWYNFRGKDGDTPYSVKQSIERVSGKSGQRYFMNLIRDINGTGSSSYKLDIADALTRNAKAAAVGVNLRVVVQQPTAYLRAASEISPKYLAAAVFKRSGIKKAFQYCPIAQWKAWGYYDMSIGKSMKELITGTQTGTEKIKEASLWAAGKADEITWGTLWNACELEVAATKRGLNPGTEAFNQAVGARLSEIIDRTQVVDTVFHRSQIMRSKDGLVKMSTAFMSEPTKTYNMLYRAAAAYAQNKGIENGKQLIRVAATHVLTSIATAAVAALVDAFRDDDEEKDWTEKYVSNLADNMLDGLNPLNLIPIGKEVMSLIDGYDPSRLDTQGIEKIINVGRAWVRYAQGESGWSLYRMIYKSADALSSVTGIPVGNFLRAFNSIYNTVSDKNLLWDDSTRMKSKIKNALAANDAYAMQKAIDEYLEKANADYQKQYKKDMPDEKSKQKSESWVKGIIKNMYASGELTREQAENALKQYAGVDDDASMYRVFDRWDFDNSKADDDDTEYPGVYDRIFSSIMEGSSIDAHVSELESNGYEKESINTAIRQRIREWYQDKSDDGRGSIGQDQAVSMLTKYCDLSSDDAQKRVKQWACYVDTGINYDDIRNEFNAGNITANRVKEMLVQYGGLSTDDAQKRVTAYEFFKEYPEYYSEISEEAIGKYNEYCKGAGVDVKVFADAYAFKNDAKADVDKNGDAISGSKRKKILDYINKLGISNTQKDALYYAFGYAESTIKDAPWR